MSDQLVFFRVNHRACALPVAEVHEVLPIVRLTELPGGPAFLAGTIDVRGEILCVLDLSVRFGGRPTIPTTATNVLQVNGRYGRLGLIVDAVDGIVTPTGDEDGVDPASIFGLEADVVSRVVHAGDELVAVLSIDRLLGTHEQEELREQQQRHASEPL